jgi:hypothetical protein
MDEVRLAREKKAGGKLIGEGERKSSLEFR